MSHLLDTKKIHYHHLLKKILYIPLNKTSYHKFFRLVMTISDWKDRKSTSHSLATFQTVLSFRITLEYQSWWGVSHQRCPELKKNILIHEKSSMPCNYRVHVKIPPPSCRRWLLLYRKPIMQIILFLYGKLLGPNKSKLMFLICKRKVHTWKQQTLTFSPSHKLRWFYQPWIWPTGEVREKHICSYN